MNNLVILLFISSNVLTGVRNLPAEPVCFLLSMKQILPDTPLVNHSLKMKRLMS